MDDTCITVIFYFFNSLIVLAIGGWLFYKQVDKLNKDVAWLNKEIQTKVREIDGMMKKLSQKNS